MSTDDTGGLSDRLRKCLKGEHDHGSTSTERTHKNRIRKRVFRSIADGRLLWRKLPDSELSEIFNQIDVEALSLEQRVDQTEIKKARQLRRGIVGWLAMLYTGTEKAKNWIPIHGVTGNPEIEFDFESLIEEAVRKAETRRGKQVTKFSFEVETRPAPTTEAFNRDVEDLLSRFESGDMGLTGAEIAHLQSEVDRIGPEEVQSYHEEIRGTPTDRGGGMGADPLEKMDSNK